IFIAGDSTGDSSPGYGGKTVGWGKFLSNYVSIPVNNYAKSGRSTRTFWREGRWNTLINGVTEGDYVFIQFGHNDGGGPNDEKERGCVNGTGNETVTVTLKSGKKEVVHTFSWYLRQMVNQVLAKKAHPIILSQTPRKIFKKGKIEAPGRFRTDAMNVAKELGIPFIDMYNYIARQYESLGENYLVKNGWFPADYLHTSAKGADFNAKLLI
ncbi:rhamnogalacturonan acetylesterase, partial [Neocallimastix californiae]